MSYNDSNPVLIDSTQSEVVEKRTNTITRHRSLYSMVDIDANQMISDFTWTNVYSKPSYLTIQISEREHIELIPEYLECMNHSCDPNCFFDTTACLLISLKPIKAGEELTFYYPSAEWDMDKAFQCLCGSTDCLGLIQGAKYLSDELISKYRFTDFIQEKLALK